MTVLIGVLTTGVVCRAGCPGRPHPRNTVVVSDLAAARRRGLRPCLRCRPDRETAPPGAPHRFGTRRPFAADQLVAFLAARAIPGVETVGGRRYSRRLRLPHAVAELSLDIRDDGVDVAMDADARDVPELFQRVRALLDLDADAPEIDAALAQDPWLGPRIAARPGVRSPGILDPVELLVRAIVGQQISVAAARTVLGRLCRDGLFPPAEELAEADPATLPMPRARARTLTRACAALAADATLIDDRERLLALPGIGPWTADYVALRRGDRDAFLPTDLHVRRALAGADPDRWRPYRAHALHHLWLSGPGRDPSPTPH